MHLKAMNIKGMTLIEVVLYLAIFAMFFIVMINFFFFVQDSNQLSGETLKIDRSTILITQHFEDSFKQSDSVGINTIPDIDNGTLELLGDVDVTYSILDSRLQFDNSESTKPITRSDIQVTKFLLEEILDNSDTVIGVKITVGIRSASDTTINSEFTNSYIID
ncbi:hypothetical protein KC675_01015 [Candidatus Dojkabacteria bacterium]|jgi:hypothetical protein|uniref:Uncharacterized protein n=1 Tax=Candidatus Dojkabacteria bacterium TaxID=2099670 RepID=A0A955IDN6_9BACT|nr:hypothetical protein [Candidatus Dojkabacteria bacterium]